MTYYLEAARAELDRQAQIYEANLQANRDICIVELDALEVVNFILEDELATALAEHWYDSFEFHFTVGLVAGVGVGYLLGRVL